MSIGIFCFLGFLYALFTLGQGRLVNHCLTAFESHLSGLRCLKLDGGFWRSTLALTHPASRMHVSVPDQNTLIQDDLHPFLGPVLIIFYALLSNTLLLTVLVAILGNTFATINADAAAEVGTLR